MRNAAELTQETRVESDTELPDQIVHFRRRLRLGDLREEVGRARLGDGSQVGDHVVLGHPDACVRDV